MDIISIIFILLIHAVAYVALQTTPTRFLNRARKFEQVDRATSDAIFEYLSVNVSSQQTLCFAGINECKPTIKSARILWYLNDFIPSHPDIDPSTIHGRKKLKMIALEEEKRRKPSRSHLISMLLKPAPSPVDATPLKMEATPRKDITTEHHLPQKVLRETTSPVEVILEATQEATPKKDVEMEDGPVEGDRVLEITSENLPQEHSLMEDIPSTVTEEPTVHHHIPIPDPPNSIPHHIVAEMPGSPPTPPPTPLNVIEDRLPSLSSPTEDIVFEPMHVEDTTAQDLIPEEMITGKTAAQEIITSEVIQEDTVMEEAIPEDVDSEDTFTEEATPDEMIIEETTPAARISVDMTSGEATPEAAIPEEMAIEATMPAEMITGETTKAAPFEAMEVDQDARDTAPAAETQIDQGNVKTPTVQPPPAHWYAKPVQHKGTKRFIVADHYSEQCCREKRRGGDQGNRQAVYPRDVSLDRFQAGVRLFPPVRLQLMLEGYVAVRIYNLNLSTTRLERHYLERLIRTPEQNDKDYSFDTLWRNYAASRPYGQREPPFTLDEAVSLITSCLAASLPNNDWFVRNAEHDFREELLKEVKGRYEELKEISWSSSWVSPRQNAPHLAQDPTGQIQRFSRDYARKFLYYIIDKDNLRASFLSDGGGNNADYWIDGVRRRSDFISIRDPKTPWYLRRENNFQLLATWGHDDMKDCRDFMHFTNVWFGECIASGTPPEAAKIKFGRFDKDRCDWLRHYAGAFPQKKQ
ncbi:hypothetical protein VMCG_08766 [Cytospora schulzeri]|uniref:Uncharacterized protein n=1 Tax=Cytospora schulzeri TaxID=448051 RepID=A0A423VS73_9PEZI|nr:hypothetical protein VMCG_08766 [Valsa malicola]